MKEYTIPLFYTDQQQIRQKLNSGNMEITNNFISKD